jgi:hypothetical protein
LDESVIRNLMQEGRKELFCPYSKTCAQTLGEQDRVLAL